MGPRLPTDDVRVFRAVYRAHYGFVWHALHRLGVREAALPDGVQDVFVVAFRRGDQRGESTKAWLYGIARRVAANARRADRRHQRRRDAVREAVVRHTDQRTWSALLALNQCLAGLSEDQRELFLLAELEGMTGPEIAQAYGVKVQTVYSRLRKVRARVRDSVESIEDVKRTRPQASMGAWAALVPALSPAPVAAWAGASVWLLLAAGTVVGGLWLAPRIGSRPSPESATTHAHVEPTASARSVTDKTTAAPVAVASTRIAPTPTPDIHRPQRLRKPRAVPSEDLSPQPVPSASEEGSMLKRAAEALRAGDTENAKRILDRHARAFPASPLADLRHALSVEVLCGLGKVAQARGEAARFREAHPASPFRRRIDNSCAGG